MNDRSSATVTVVIPHHGSPDPTRALVAALRSQSVSDQLQIVVSDDASPEPYSGDADCIVRSEENTGFGSTVNAGVTRATAEHLLVLNSDVVMAETFVEELLAGARAWMPAVVSPQVHEPWGVRCVGHAWPTTLGLVVEMLDPLARFHGRPWFNALMGNDVSTVSPAAPRPTGWATGVCLLMPTADFRAVGGFDESFFMNCEEVDLQRRLADRGLAVVVLERPVLEHEGGGSSDPLKRSGWLFDSRMRYHQKWGHPLPLALGWYGAALTNLVWNTARSAAGRDIDARAKFVDQHRIITHAWRNRR